MRHYKKASAHWGAKGTRIDREIKKGLKKKTSASRKTKKKNRSIRGSRGGGSAKSAVDGAFRDNRKKGGAT